ncbi:MAG: hypothetical protein IKP46_03770 [Bacteroidales bacterium]|nr:hypothetical protein [Bacteroidales bacterium]
MKPLSLALFALVIVGCSQEQPHNELLSRAAQIVFTQPDSVVRMLSPYYYDSAMTDADRALYGLLYTEALHRSGLSTASDSLIRASRDFYERHGDDEHLSRALLHHGIILYRQQQVHEAVLSMKRAELLSGDLDLPAFKWYLYCVLGDVNDNVGNHALTLRYYKQALKAARQCDSRQWTVQTLNNIAMTFDMLGQKDSLRYYTEQAQPYYEDTYGDVRATYLANCASYMLSTGQRQEAKRCLIESRLISPTNRGEKLLADIYMAEGDTAAAIQQWYRLSGSLSPDVAIQSYRQLITYMNCQGDLRGVAEFSQRLNEVYHRLYEHSDAAVIDLQAQFDEQIKERRQYRTVIVLLAAILLVIVLSALVIWYNRRRMDLLNARFAESQMQYNLTRTELTQMRRMKEREQRENSRQLKDIVSRLHAAAGKGKPAPDDEMNALAQLSYAMRPKLRELLSPLSSKEQQVCLLTVHHFLPSEIANLTIATPQAITNTRVRLLRKLFGETGGAKDFDTAIMEYGADDVI